MNFLEEYHLFLFDFDGLLVNTEELHFQAYQKMCQGRGRKLPWNFERYCQIAHYSATGPEEGIFDEFPDLKEEEPSWQILYREKAAAYTQLVEEGKVLLMPGAEAFLTLLQERRKRHAVVTHSSMRHIDIIRKQHPILEKIPFWITREDYKEPKPSPECYNVAIRRLSEGKKAIGFEDTPRGLQALYASGAKALLISQISYPEIPQFLKQGVEHYRSFCDFMDNRLS